MQASAVRSQPSGWRTKTIWALFLILVAALPSGAQVVVEEIGALQDAFAKAQASFQAYKFSDAAGQLSPIVDTLTKWERSGRLQAADEALLEKSLELRGACEFNTGKTDIARQDFTRLLQLRPEYPFAAGKAPKLQRFFEEIRSALTGALELDVDPADSQVLLDGRPVTAGAALTLPVLKGLHVLKVAHPGYDSQERELNVELGQTLPVSVRLSPNARTIYFFVRPAGVQLQVDGKLIGTATEAASTQEDWRQFVQDAGFDPATTYVAVAPYLAPGERRIALKKQCYRKQEFKLPVALGKAGNAPGFVRPIELEQKTVELLVTSIPSGAQVSVDGQNVGATPLRKEAFCIGDHEFLVSKPGAGEYRALVTVTPQSPFQVEALLRPTLLWAGLTRNQEVTPEQQDAARASVSEAFGKMRFFNGAEPQEKDPLLPDTFFTPGVSAQEQAEAARQLCEKSRCQGLLAAQLVSASGKLRFSARLFVPGLQGFDEFSRPLSKAQEAASVLAEIDRPVFDVSPRRLLRLADAGQTGPVVLGGTSDPGGPQMGDALLAVGDKAASTASDAYSALETDPRQPKILRLLHDGVERSWTLDTSKAAGVLPYGGFDYGYRRMWLLSRQATLVAESLEDRVAAGMNLASAELNLGRPERALQALDAVQPQEGSALGPQAVGYLRAVALAQLGRVEEARPLLTACAADRDASLDGWGLVLVQPLAVDLLRQLPAPPAPALPESGKKK
jgi:hypothetical protein